MIVVFATGVCWHAGSSLDQVPVSLARVDMPERPYRACLTWVVVEVGESSFNIGTAADDPKNPIQWEPWCSIVRKGRPETLIHAVTWPIAKLFCNRCGVVLSSEGGRGAARPSCPLQKQG